MFFHRVTFIIEKGGPLKKIPTSLFGRGSRILGMAGKLALDEVSGRLKTWEDEKEKMKARVKSAQDVVKTLSQLKGASMKLGQLLSLDFGDYLPPEIMKILETLHQESTFLPFEKIEKILQHELGEKLQDFTDISQKPIAAASIGQVHRARLKGNDVVIKVQYPGIAESIPSDLRLLELILKQASFIPWKKETDIKPFMDEVKDVLIKEADYQHELSMHLLYREKFSGRPYVIPEAYSEYSTGKVLTQEFIEGVNFSKWLETHPEQSVKEKMADLLMRLYLEEIFELRIVQTDPNPGNFLMTPDNRIALLDFGAVKIYNEDFVEGYRKILIASYHKETEIILNESIRIGFLDERENEEVREIYLRMIDFLSEPFRHDDYFDFTDKNFFEKSRDLSWELTRKCRFTPPPKDLLFLHRKLGGVFIFLKRLNVKIRLKDYWYYVEGS